MASAQRFQPSTTLLGYVPRHAAETVIAAPPDEDAPTVLVLDQPVQRHAAPTVIAPPAPVAAPAPHTVLLDPAIAAGAPAVAARTPALETPRPASRRLARALRAGLVTGLVLAALAYVGTRAFYAYSQSWIVPTAISADDPAVIVLQAQVTAQQNERDRLTAELARAEVAIASEQGFQAELDQARQHDREIREAAQARVRRLASAARAPVQYDDDAPDEAELARRAELEQRAAELASQTRALDALLTGQAEASALEVQRAYDASRRELARNTEARARIVAGLERQDELLCELRQAAPLRALADHAAIALVPVASLDRATRGAPIFACKVEMIGCHEVGTVGDLLPGEVQVNSPHRDAQVQARMIEMQLTESDAAAAGVLFVGGKPLGL